MKKGVLVVVFLLCSVMVFSQGFSSNESVVVSVKSAPPFVMVRDDGSINGFSIELVQSLLDDVVPNREVVFRNDNDLVSHIRSVESGMVDFGIAATTITADLEKKIDFSQPFFEAPLGIITPIAKRASLTSVIFSTKVLSIVFIILLYIIVCAHLIWFAEHGTRTFSHAYWRGIWQGMWWTVVTMSTVGYGDFAPKKVFGRILGIIVIFSGIALFGIAVATLSSALTVTGLPGDTISLEGLTAQNVGVISGTNGATIIKSYPVKAIEYASLSSAISGLQHGQITAIIHDLPFLKHYTIVDPEVPVTLSRSTFASRNYGIVFSKDSEWYDPINNALLQQLDDEKSDYYFLRKKWFGNEN